VFLSEDWGAWPGGDGVAVPLNVGTEGRDHNNVGHQLTRDTYGRGNHNHGSSGPSHHETAKITNTGGNQPFNVRQSFMVVQYIIHIAN
jgi:hypothetical protein